MPIAPSARRRRIAAAVTGLAAAGASALVALPGPAAAAPATRVETPLRVPSPVADVLVSQVTIDAPLPATAGAHPAACDKLSYLRFRHRSGPAASAAAARVTVSRTTPVTWPRSPPTTRRSRSATTWPAGR